MSDQQTQPLEASGTERDDATQGPLSLSVAWGYVCSVLLMLFIFLILVPDADGPSPWDAAAFQSAMLEMAANFRILDELADLSIVKVADVGEGFLKVDLDLIGISNRKFGWAPFWIAIVLVLISLLLRGLRQSFLTRLLGDSPSGGQFASYFFGRGMNLFFPFGAGEYGIAQSLIQNGVSPPVASRVVFYNRVFEVLAIQCLLIASFAYLGWEGAVEPVFWGVLLVAAIGTVTRPLGHSAHGRVRFNPLVRIWSAFNGRAVARAIADLSDTPRAVLGLSLLSIAALALEVLAYWCIKQAFSSPMDDYILMKDLHFINFAVVIVVASLARVLPYTFASLGVYELASVAMFWVFDEGFLGATTVTLLDSLLVNGMSLFLFVIFLWRGRCPSVFDTWRGFFAHSNNRSLEQQVTAADSQT